MRLLPLFFAVLGVFSFEASLAREVQCRFLSFQAEPPALLGPSPKGEPAAVEIAAEEISSPAKYMTDDNNRLLFVDPKDPKKVLLAVTVPASASSVILVMVPAPAVQPLPWNVMVIDDSLAQFPDGGVFVANFQPQEIRFMIGEYKLMLKAGATHAVQKPTQVDDFNMAPTLFEFRKGEKWNTASESVQRFIPGLRYLMFCYLDQSSGRPRVASYSVK